MKVHLLENAPGSDLERGWGWEGMKARLVENVPGSDLE